MAYSDTIAGIATPAGVGGIGIIRLSGADARQTADKVFRSKKGSVRDAKGYTALYGKIYDGDRLLDEAVALIFAAPASYTGEDVVELSVHGGAYIVKSVLRAVISAGARLSEPGEITRRAFENGKMDLSEAEAVMGLISAEGEQDHRAALAAKEGAVSRKIEALKQRLIFLSASLAAYSDYPDEDIPQLKEAEFLEELKAIKDETSSLLATYDAGRIIRYGIDTVIAGRPNVGKSTLMNLLSGTERSIVTPVAGTTRDVIEESVQLGNVRLKLADTAGLRNTDDPVESIGVERSRSRLESAGLILAVFDASVALDGEDEALLQLCRHRPAVLVINKTDLPSVIDKDMFLETGLPVVLISALSDQVNPDDSKSEDEAEITGLAGLRTAVGKVTGISALDPDAAMLASERQRQSASEAAGCLGEAVEALTGGFTLDAVGVCMDGALSSLLSLTGERVTTSVVDEVFRKFCVGK